MREKALILIILSLATAFFWNWLLWKPVSQVSQADQMKIITELRQRSADDCVITDQGSYWRAEEMATGKVFKVTK